MNIQRARSKMRRRIGGIYRPRDVAPGDKRSPMLRLLQDGNVGGNVQVNYAAQWPTYFKAKRLGYIDDCGDLTDAGAAFVKSH